MWDSEHSKFSKPLVLGYVAERWYIRQYGVDVDGTNAYNMVLGTFGHVSTREAVCANDRGVGDKWRRFKCDKFDNVELECWRLRQLGSVACPSGALARRHMSVKRKTQLCYQIVD